jgi:hypothetical protein
LGRALCAAVGLAVNAYPKVLSEWDTLQRVVNGASLSRYGDGELRQADRPCNIKPQKADAKLTVRLREILIDSGECLVGIPNIHDRGPKDLHWQTYKWSAKLLNPSKTYGSAFISRPDSAPWINTDEYWATVQSLWRDRDVTLVRGAQKSLTKEVLIATGAREVHEVMCKPNDAWEDYGQIMREIGSPERVLLCLGPTATVMAVDLCARGIHAVDLGHLGLFYKKHLRGDPMVRTESDKVAK